MVQPLDLRKLPEHKFGFASIKTLNKVYSLLSKTYPKLIQALEQRDIEKFTAELAAYASYFLRCLARDQKCRWEFIDAYQSIVLKFLEHYLHEQGITTVSLSQHMSETALIEYGKLCNLCIDLFADYQELTNTTATTLVDFSRLFVLRPFILNLFPIDPNRLLSLQHRSVDFRIESSRRLHFKETLQQHVLAKNQEDQRLLNEIAADLLRLHNRYLQQDHSWYRWARFLWMRNPTNKLRQIDWLYLVATRKRTSLGEFMQALETTLANPNIQRHRLRLNRVLSCLFKVSPPQAVIELSRLHARLSQSRIYPELIAERLAQPC